MKKKTIKRIIASALSAIIMTQVIPISASAIQNLKRTEISESSLKESVPNIVKEVKDERGEFNKVYLLEDGSYCNISTFAPIHEKVKGKWENIDNTAIENVETIEEAQNILNNLSSEQNNQQNTTSSSSNIELDINTTGCTLDETTGEITLKRKSCLVAKTKEPTEYFNTNKLILKAYVNVDFRVNGKADIYLKKMSDYWNSSTNFYQNTFSTQKSMDKKHVSSSGIYSFDITDLFVRWDKGVEYNYGFVLQSQTNTCNMSFDNISISIIYRDVDESDTMSTYHTVDMGKAGTVYINDLTNTVKVEQDILTVPRKFLPIHLKRVYNYSDTYNDNNSTGFHWNYESSIQLKDGIASWKTLTEQ